MMMRNLAFAFVALVGPAAGHAYPIPAQTLWQQVENAEHIVVAVVRGHVDHDGEDWNSTAAVLEVEETWKGAPVERVEVPYPAGLICPAPPRYVEGERVLAFLERHQGAWSTVALSYGTLYPDARDLPVFRERVRAALELQGQGEVEQAARVAWHVDTASRRATRWHGVYPLQPGGIQAYYDRGREPLATVPEPELFRLAEGWVAEPDPGSTLPMVLALLAGYGHRGVDTTAVAAIDALMEEERLPHWTGPAMAWTLERVGRGAAWEPPAKPDEPLVEDPIFGLARKPDHELRALWVEHRPEIDVPELTLARLRPARVGRVGGDTPP